MKRARNKKSTQINNKTNKKTKNKTNNRPVLVTVFVLLFTILAGVIGFSLWLNSQKGNSALIPVDEKQGKINVLLLGVDNGGLRTDAMMLVSFDYRNSSANIMSIPRDTKMIISDRKLTRKINEIHAMTGENKKPVGPIASVKAVSALTGLPVHYYIEFNFDAIDDLADILGPVRFDVPDIEGNGKGMNYDDPAQDLHIHLKPGLQELTGNEIQQFLRYRKSNSGKSSGSDLDRVKRQQALIGAIVDQKLNTKLINKLPSIYGELSSNMQTNMSLDDIALYSKYLKDFDADNISSFSYPGESKSLKGGWYFVPNFEEAAEIIRENFGYEDITADDLSDSIKISGVYGTGNILKSEKKSSNNSKLAADEEPTKTTNTKNTSEDNKKSSESEKEKEDTKTETEDKAENKSLNKISTSDDNKSSEKNPSKNDDLKTTSKETTSKNTDTKSSESLSKDSKTNTKKEDILAKTQNNKSEVSESPEDKTEEDEYIMLD